MVVTGFFAQCIEHSVTLKTNTIMWHNNIDKYGCLQTVTLFTVLSQYFVNVLVLI